MGRFTRSDTRRACYAAHNIKNRAKNRSRAGFTITEVLLVVAILVVLFAVTIIGISSYQASLRQKELDSKAEVIYMAAQNRLTELAAAGRSDLYQPYKQTTITTSSSGTTTKESGHTDVKEIDLTSAEEKPRDLDDAEITTLCYVSSPDIKVAETNAAVSGSGEAATAAVILPENRVEAEIRDNYWVIEYNPDSASVYGVFYIEDAGAGTDTGLTYSPSTFNEYRAKEIRLSDGAKIGYYGGDTVYTVEITKISPSITVYNEETLTAVISCKDPFGSVTEAAPTFDIKVEDEFGNVWTDTITPSERGEGGSYLYTLVLDDLNGKRFADVYGKENQGGGEGGNLVPGSNITITVLAKSNSSKSKYIEENSASATTNSLFGDNKTGDNTNATVEIEYARHLQNLDEGSGVTKNATATDEAKRLVITKAIQTKYIHFDDDTNDVKDWYTLYTANTTNKIDFTPITNAYLTSYVGSAESTSTGDSSSTGSSSTSSGTTASKTERYAIYGLNTTSGLFETFYGSELKDITLYGTTITGSGSNANGASGAIAGSVTGSSLSISGCQVYLDQTKDKLDSKDENDIWIKGSSYVGGLVGYVSGSTNVSIEDSFAATVLGTKTTGNTGGLVGYAASGASVTVNKSYADCYLYGKNVGGLVGGGSGSLTVTNSYASGFSYASNVSGGFTPGTISSANNSYSVLSYKGDSVDKDKNYGIASGKNGTVTDTYYIARNGMPDSQSVGKEEQYADMIAEKFATTLGSEFTMETGGGLTRPYNLMENMGLESYPYPRLSNLTHYCDWEAGIESKTPVYYEVYESKDSDGNVTTTYGFYGMGSDHLSKSGTAVGDGYGVIYTEEPQQNVEFEYSTSIGSQTATLLADEKIEFTVAGTKYWLLKFPAAAVDTDKARETFYQEFKVDSTSYYYNPHLARTITTSMPADKAAAETALKNSTLYVRTARQLYNLSLYYKDYADVTKTCTFAQDLEIDYTTYKWSTYSAHGTVKSQGPIAANKTSEYKFFATYNGKNNIVTGVSFVNPNSGEYYAGMFGNNAGTLQNIAIVWDYGKTSENRTVGLTSTIAGGSTEAYLGCLAGQNAGYINNCAVTGYTFDVRAYENTHAYIGGLVGRNTIGTIANSYADTPSATLELDYSTTRFGGLVGENSHLIRSCYAQTAVKVSRTTGGDVKVAGFCGVNANTIRNSYCASSVITDEHSTGIGFAYGGSISNCYYLYGGTYYYAGDLRPYNKTYPTEAATQVTAEELKAKTISGFGSVDADSTYEQYNEKTKKYDTGYFPYPSSYKDASGKYTHYGNWPVEADMGSVGVMYWEYESTGTNVGYHFHYIGISGSGTEATGTGKSSLCTTHTDGGIITDYGYAYYIKKSDKTAGTTLEIDSRTTGTNGGFGTLGDENTVASAAIERQLSGFDVKAYSTGYDSTKKNGLYLTTNAKNGNGIFVLKYTKNNTSTYYSFTICPFFADALSYNGTLTSATESIYSTTTGATGTKPTGTAWFEDDAKYLEEPGQADNTYEIRSDDQLQYMNWNAEKLDATLSLTGSGNSWNDDFTYLKYVYGNDPNTSEYNFYWVQTHDVDQKGSSTNTFTPIGSMYYYDATNRDNDRAWIAYMGGSYDGQSYMIKNIEINTTNAMVGLFGITIGAHIENVIMYSEKNNNIVITDNGSGSYTWYSVGGLVGFAARNPDDQAAKAAVIRNCSVSGYTIKDCRTENGFWGGGSVGGLIGSSNMDIEKCSAVNDIKIEIGATYNYNSSGVSEDYKNLRVGGLVGNLRATVDRCYSGGTITSSKTTTSTGTDDSDDTCIWIGGINGGIVMIHYGNLEDLIGSTVGDVIISNSYTYVNMQAAGSNQIKHTSPIGSLGEMYSAAFAGSDVPNSNVQIRNCYIYEKYAETTTDNKTSNLGNSSYWSGANLYNISDNNGYSEKRTISYNNSGHSPFVTYDQLSADETDTNGVLYLLKNNGTACGATNATDFSFVTTRENNTLVNGKYSYPGNVEALNGSNYPFPAILTQPTSLGTAYVHYGKWPTNRMFWQKPRLSFDLFENYDSSNQTSGESIKLTMDTTSSETVTYTSLDESGATIDSAKIVAKVDDTNMTTEKDSDNNTVYNLFISGLREGTGIIKATQGTTTAELMVNITAKLIMAAEPQTVELDKADASGTSGDSETVEVTCKSANGKVDFTDKATWSVTSNENNIAVVTGTKGSGKYVLTVSTSNSVGTTELTVTAKYAITLKDSDGNAYQKETEETLTIPVTVTDSSAGSGE